MKSETASPGAVPQVPQVPRASQVPQTPQASGMPGAYRDSRAYPWIVFTLTFSLMLSDYLSRQVMGAVFPFLKADWGLSDTQLGGLVSIVSLVVGVMTVPMSLMADRWGRVRSITLMAVVWCVATLACGLASSYTELLLARAAVGLGEAAYAAAGAAILAHTFPIGKRSAVLGAFQSAGLFGSVLGVIIGGAVASQYGWRTAFFVVGAPGLVLAFLYPWLVRDYATAEVASTAGADGSTAARLKFGTIVKMVFEARSGNFTFIAFGLQMGVPALLIAWVPTYFNRFYGYDARKAALMAAVVVLVAGLGMLFGGGVADHISRGKPQYRPLVPAGYALLSGVLLIVAFALPPGPSSLGLFLAGALFAAAHGGSAVAMVIDVTHPAVHATVTAAAVLGASLLGLAPMPWLVGLLSDMTNLKTALTIAPVVSLVAALFFVLASRSYVKDVAKYAS